MLVIRRHGHVALLAARLHTQIHLLKLPLLLSLGQSTYRVGDDDHMFDATEFFIGPMLTVAPPDGCLVKVGSKDLKNFVAPAFTRWRRAEATMRLHPRRLKLSTTQGSSKPSVLAWDLLEIFLSDLMLITY